MDLENRGALQLVALAGAVVVLLGVAAVAGFAINDTSPTGAEVLSDVEDRYQSADSVLVDANVTAEHNDSVTRYTVNSVTTNDGQRRTNVSNGSDYFLIGQTENTTWVTDSRNGATVVISSGNVTAQSPMTGIGGMALPGFTAADVGPDNESLSVWVYGLDNATAASVGDSWNQSRSLEGMNTSMDSVEWNESSTHPMDFNWTDGDSMAHPFSENGAVAHDLNRTSKHHELENKSITALLEETNLSAELIETTTVDDQKVHVVEVSHPQEEGSVNVWATTDPATVVKYQVSSPNMTMTTDIRDTRFNVSPAQSTFQPPVASQRDRTSANTLNQLQDAAPFPVGVPSENWEFTGGSVVASPMEATIGQYESNGSAVAVIQSTSTTFDRFSEEGRTVDIGDRNVTVTEISDGRTIARWSQDEQTVMVAGDVSETVLLEFVRGLELKA